MPALPERFHAVVDLYRLLGARTPARGAAAAYADFVTAAGNATNTPPEAAVPAM